MDSKEPDLEKIKEDLHSLDSEDYIRFLKEVHFECPFKTEALTNEIVNHWKNDHSMKRDDYNDILEEREAEHNEKAEQRKQEDLQRIQDMKSKTGLDPLQLFPKEIWIMLIDLLPSEDKLNFRKIHKTFQDLTEDKRIGDILLPMMINFKVERFWNDPHHYKWAEKPLLCPLAQCTELRLVSKTLRNAVDRHYEDDIITKLHSGEKNARPLVVVEIDLQNLDDVRKFARMRAHLSSPPKLQRFFTRSLHIASPRDAFPRPQNDDEAEELARFDEHINGILDRIGDQIWYFSFEFNYPSYVTLISEPSFTKRYTTFLGWLGRMPNLKWLKLSLNLSEFDSKYGCRFPEGPGSTPPTLIHLERLDLELKKPNRYLMHGYTQLLAANPHVKILNLIGLKSVLKETNGFVNTFAEDPAKIPLKLETLFIDGSTSFKRPFEDYYDSKFDNCDGSKKDEMEFDDGLLFQSIIETKWPLRQIDWELDARFHPNIDQLFHWLSTIKTLERLRLSLDDVGIRYKSAFLQLPELTHFEFKIKKSSVNDKMLESAVHWSFLFSLQFLIFAKKLKTLIWNCDMEEEAWNKVSKDRWVMSHQLVGDILDFEWVALKLLGVVEAGDIAKSNIWRAFRGLDTLVLELAVRVESKVAKSVSKKYLRRDLDINKLSSNWVYPTYWSSCSEGESDTDSNNSDSD